jgi:UDP-glucose 4-epimerase
LNKILITGSSGFLGRILQKSLYENNIIYDNTDIIPSNCCYGQNVFIQGDLCSKDFVNELFNKNRYGTVIHLASQIDFAVKDQKSLYDNNVISTQNIAEAALKFGTKKIIFTSSNSVYLGNNETLNVTENDKPSPNDEYGFSKIKSENILNEIKNKVQIIIIRPPNIIDSGRVGMLSILFELLESNSAIWTIGDGSIKYQCIYAQDLINLIIKLLKYNKNNIFNVGSERVPCLRDMYIELIKITGSKSKVRKIPKFASIPLLKLFYKLKISPLGPYQFQMLTKSFIFDTSYVKKELDWYPTLNNTEMLKLAYEYYRNNKTHLSKSKLSANSSDVKLGVLKLLKYIN